MKNSALWRVVDNESGTQSIVSTPSEAVAFVNSRFDTDDDDEPFGITKVGPLLPKPLGVITAWAAEKDGERTDGRTAPIIIRPVVTDSAIECDAVVLWGDVYVSWDHDMYTIEGPDGSEYSEAGSAAELSEILDECAGDYEYVPEGSDSHTRPNSRALMRYGAQECADRIVLRLRGHRAVASGDQGSVHDQHRVLAEPLARPEREQGAEVSDDSVGRGLR